VHQKYYRRLQLSYKAFFTITSIIWPKFQIPTLYRDWLRSLIIWVALKGRGVVKTFTVVHKMPRYLLIYHKYLFLKHTKYIPHFEWRHGLNIFPVRHIKRDSTIEKQSPLHWMKVRPLKLIGWNPWINKRVIELHTREGEHERHLLYFLIQRGNYYSIVKSLLAYQTIKRKIVRYLKL
jgi:hypothetical protein